MGERRFMVVQAFAGIALTGVLLLALALVLVGPPARPMLLAASLNGVPRGADVVDIKPVPAAKPAEPMRPIDVPNDPYAAEAVVKLGRLAIPKLGVDQQLMHGVTLNNIDHGPSHWPGSAWPGQVGNSVIAGHRVTHSKPFRNVDQLGPGDEVIVTARGVRATYAVTETFVVYPKDTYIVDPSQTATLTLFACHPPRSARQRIVVRAALVRTDAA